MLPHRYVSLCLHVTVYNPPPLLWVNSFCLCALTNTPMACPPAAGSVLGTKDDTYTRLPAPALREGGVNQERDTSLWAGSLCFKLKSMIGSKETESCWTHFTRLIWKPDDNVLIFREGCISFWISHPEHCLSSAKGSGKICIVSKLGITRFLGEQWNQSKTSGIAVVVCEVSDHLWITESFKNLRKSLLLEKNNICVIFADSVSKVMKLVRWPRPSIT